MTGEEYANNKVNEQDSSTHSQHVKNSIPNFCGFDLHDAFEAGQDAMKKKAADAFCYVNCHKLKCGDCSMVDECGGFKNFKELLNKEQ